MILLRKLSSTPSCWRPLISRTLSSEAANSGSKNAKEKRIGIVGMGHVGDAVLRNLTRKGFRVSAINDIDLSKCGGYTNDIKILRSAREVAAECDVVVTGLPKPPDVRAAFEGADGLLAGMGEGKVWIDHTTTDFGQNVEFESALCEKGAFLLEAPITGGLDALRKGQMAVWVAGDKTTFKECEPILDASYSTVMYTGRMGTAMIPKVMSNMLCCAQVVAMGEILMIAKRSNLDLTTFWHVIRSSSGTSFLWETAGPNIFRGDFHDSFNLDLQCKDIQLCYDMAKETRTPIEFLGRMQQIYHRAQYQLGDDRGCYSPPRLMEEALGEKLQTEGFEEWSYDVENHDGALHVKHKGIDFPK